MGNTRQYIGARYVPVFADPVQWDNVRSYEALTIVTNNGNSYTSRKPVPAGVDISDTEYWANTGNYNQQIEDYRQEVEQYKNNVAELGSIAYKNNKSYWSNYKAGSLLVAVDWLSRAAGSTSIVTQRTDISGKVACVYDINKGYLGFLGRPLLYNTFVNDDTVDIGGTNYKVCYMDCSTFLSLVTKNLDYNNSLYSYALTNPIPDIDISDAFNNYVGKCEELGGDNVNWTIDFNNYVITDRMAQLLEYSGNPAIVIDANQVNVDGLDTGALLFIGGNQGNGYKGIFHCGYYVKSLDEINGLYPNLTVRAIDNMDGANGYVIHMTQNNGNTDNIRINTLNYFATLTDNISSSFTIYAYMPFSNWMNSTLKRMQGLKLFTCPRFIGVYGGKESGKITQVWDVHRGMLMVDGVAQHGASLTKVTDLNTLLVGTYKWVSLAMTNAPAETSVGVCVLTVEGNNRGTNIPAVQTLKWYPAAGAATPPKVYYRYINASGPSSWYSVTLESV